MLDPAVKETAEFTLFMTHTADTARGQGCADAGSCGGWRMEQLCLTREAVIPAWAIFRELGSWTPSATPVCRLCCLCLVPDGPLPQTQPSKRHWAEMPQIGLFSAVSAGPRLRLAELRGTRREFVCEQGPRHPLRSPGRHVKLGGSWGKSRTVRLDSALQPPQE